MTGREEAETAKGIVVTLMDQQPSGVRMVVKDHGLPIGVGIDTKHSETTDQPADLIISGEKETPDAGR